MPEPLSLVLPFALTPGPWHQTAAAELENLNHEVTERRRACLKELYQFDQEQYEKELNALGLALVKERI